ncbi:MAG: SDR family NAD(P)-dependent oxidoreductase [Acidobacteriota bacterium]|jgi:NADP-dependent 3-hydroxy acid dehydrogenase YdfG|nr:MAG: oxidoreductase [Acidobacteriota bacterium]
MPRLEERVVAITGASAGIGLALAELLVARGASVAAFARRADRLEDLAGRTKAGPGRLLPVAGDVTREDDVQALVDRTVATFGRIDVMVCNAGIGFHGPLDATPSDVSRRLVDVNVMGTIYAARAALTEMRRQQQGHIIAVSSIVGRRGVEGSSVYAATKAAQVAFIESLRAEFAGTGLHASVVYPIATATEFHEAIRRDFGQRVSGRGPRQPADAVARAIARCIERPRPEVYPYPPSKLLAILAVVAPGATDRIVERFRRRSHADGAP